jgi:hypothetical protein
MKSATYQSRATKLWLAGVIGLVAVVAPVGATVAKQKHKGATPGEVAKFNPFDPYSFKTAKAQPSSQLVAITKLPAPNPSKPGTPVASNSGDGSSQSTGFVPVADQEEKPKKTPRKPPPPRKPPFPGDH